MKTGVPGHGTEKALPGTTTFERAAALARVFNGFALRAVAGAYGIDAAARLDRAMTPGHAAQLTLLGGCEAGVRGMRPEPSDSVRLADVYAQVFARAGYGPAEVREMFARALEDMGKALPADSARYAATLERKRAEDFARVLRG